MNDPIEVAARKDIKKTMVGEEFFDFLAIMSVLYILMVILR